MFFLPGGTTTFLYDGEAKRAKKTAAGNTTYYVDEHYEVKNGVSTKFIFAGNIRLAKITGTDRHYFHKDHLQSSTVMSNQSGAQVEATEYLPFGIIRVHSGTIVTDYKFTDQELDTSTNLYNYDARMYDPVIGRFISPDSIVPDFSILGNYRVYVPQMLNRYSYCRNNPLIYTDPTGHYTWGPLGLESWANNQLENLSSWAHEKSIAIRDGIGGWLSEEPGHGKSIAKGVVSGTSTGLNKGPVAGVVNGIVDTLSDCVGCHLIEEDENELQTLDPTNYDNTNPDPSLNNDPSDDDSFSDREGGFFG